MRRASSDEGDGASSPGTRLEAYFSGFLRRHPRLPLVLGIALAVLIVAAVLVAKFAGRGH